MSANALALELPLTLSDSKGGNSKRPMDEIRFEAFYKRTAGGVWSYLYRLTGDSAAADDLVQKTFIRFLRANPVVASDDHQRRYIYKTATNLALDHFRETKRERNRDASAPVAQPRGERNELRHDMMRVFAELKPQERALLWLAHVEESSHEEIAGALGVKSGSVRVLLFRARKRLGELLSKKGLGPEVAR